MPGGTCACGKSAVSQRSPTQPPPRVIRRDVGGPGCCHHAIVLSKPFRSDRTNGDGPAGFMARRRGKCIEPSSFGCGEFLQGRESYRHPDQDAWRFSLAEFPATQGRASAFPFLRTGGPGRLYRSPGKSGSLTQGLDAEKRPRTRPFFGAPTQPARLRSRANPASPKPTRANDPGSGTTLKELSEWKNTAVPESL